jgi:hypothetical protein
MFTCDQSRLFLVFYYRNLPLLIFENKVWMYVIYYMYLGLCMHACMNYLVLFFVPRYDFPLGSILAIHRIYSQSSLYENSHIEISLIRTFVMKRIPSAWLVIRTRARSSEIFRTKSNTWLWVLTAASMKMAVFWVVAPCSLVEVHGRFRVLAASIIREF